MFSSAGLFKSLACPERDSGRCPFLNCLFSHDPADALSRSLSSLNPLAPNQELKRTASAANLSPKGVSEPAPAPERAPAPAQRPRSSPGPTSTGPTGRAPAGGPLPLPPARPDERSVGPAPFLGCLVSKPPSAPRPAQPGGSTTVHRPKPAHDTSRLPGSTNTEKPGAAAAAAGAVVAAAAANNTDTQTAASDSPVGPPTLSLSIAKPKRQKTAAESAATAGPHQPSLPFSLSPLASPYIAESKHSQNASLLTTPNTPSTKPASPRRSPSSRPLAPSGQNPPKAPQPEKIETLNPRLVTKDPVGHARRRTYLIHIHKAMKRLNDEAAKRAAKDPAVQMLVLQPQDLIKEALNEEQDLVQRHGGIYANMIKKRIFSLNKMSLQDWFKSRREKRNVEISRARKSLSKDSSSSLTRTGSHSDVTSQTSSSSVESRTAHHTDLSRMDAYLKHRVDTGLTTAEEVHILKHSLLSEVKKLAEYGYVVSPPTDVEIQESIRGVEAASGWEVCDRCTARFQVFPGRREDGALTSKGPCSFHWGKLVYPGSSGRNRVEESSQRYSCCQGELASAGCSTHPTHVFKVTDVKRLASIMSFKCTPTNKNPMVDSVAIDCEMTFTTLGMEIVRLTVVSWPDGGQLVDTLVRPIGEPLDFNTRFSGVSTEQFVNSRPVTVDDLLKTVAAATQSKKGGRLAEDSPPDSEMTILPSPSAARDLVFGVISAETPVIGHGLENDLNVLRIVHGVISDTVVLFPHPKGLPFRRPLRLLAESHLDWQIQRANNPASNRTVLPSKKVPELPSAMRLDSESEGQRTGRDGGAAAAAAAAAAVVGHDSLEDARAAGELVRQRVKAVWAHLRSKGWKFGASGLEEPAVPVPLLRRRIGSAAVPVMAAPAPKKAGPATARAGKLAADDGSGKQLGMKKA